MIAKGDRRNSDLPESMQRLEDIDKGTAFGNFGEDGKDFYKDRTTRHLSPVMSYLKQRSEKALVGDIGGGNGLLARNLCASVDTPLSVDVLDIDTNKFPETAEYDAITYKEHDIRDPLPRTYDVTVARNVLHYNPGDQEQILQNMVSHTTTNGLVCVIQSAPIPENKDSVNDLQTLLTNMSNSNPKEWKTGEATASTLADIIGSVSHEQIPNTYRVDDFYKERYDLNQNQIKKVKAVVGDEVILPTNIIHTYT